MANPHPGENLWLQLLENSQEAAAGKAGLTACTPLERQRLAQGLRPSWAVLSCIDARVIPEQIFAAQAGEVMVARVAGCALDRHTTGSLEFACGVLKVPLLVVMGHSLCGAVAGASGDHSHLSEHKALCQLLSSVALGSAESDLRQHIIHHSRSTREQLLKESTTISRLVESGELVVKAAYYDIESGQVSEI